MLGDVALVAAVALGAYINTVRCGFAFDDQFAVVDNQDVYGDSLPIQALLDHDFWGQPIVLHGSHKSYRPLSVLALRGVRKILTPLLRPLLGFVKYHDMDDLTQRAITERGLHPLPFHVANIFLHALVSVLVLFLARQFRSYLRFNDRSLQVRQGTANGSASAGHTTNNGEAAIAQARAVTRWVAAAARTASRWHVVAALLFAVHPIHTEAVAGVVGMADLLSGALAIGAILSYAWGIVLPLAPQSISVNVSVLRLVTPLAVLRQLLGVMLAGALSLLAALSKETGITAVLACALLDIALADGVLVYAPPPEQPPAPPKAKGSESAAGGGQTASQTKEGAAPDQRRRFFSMPVVSQVETPWQETFVTAPEGFMGIRRGTKILSIGLKPGAASQKRKPPTQEELDRATKRHEAILRREAAADATACWRRADVTSGEVLVLLVLRALRLTALALVALLYLFARRVVSAGDHLVRLSRRVENPLAFTPDLLSRVAGKIAVHARYAMHLFANPNQLSADWSFDCISLPRATRGLKEFATHPLLLLGLLLYGVLVAAVVHASPLTALQNLLSWGRIALGLPRSGPARRVKSTWTSHAEHLFVVFLLWGGVVVPFLPAAHIFFFPGTLVAERLLYLPSLGFCILLAMQISMPWRSEADAPAGPSREPRRDALSKRLAPWLRASSVTVLFGALLLLTMHTVSRNGDWVDEERLFLAAERVCPRSAKVQLNLAIIDRRYSRHEKAIERLTTAQEIDPTYCDPDYLRGSSLLMLGETSEAIVALKRGMNCTHFAHQSLSALLQIAAAGTTEGTWQSAQVHGLLADVYGQPAASRYVLACRHSAQAATGLLEGVARVIEEVNGPMLKLLRAVGAELRRGGKGGSERGGLVELTRLFEESIAARGGAPEEGWGPLEGMEMEAAALATWWDGATQAAREAAAAVERVLTQCEGWMAGPARGTVIARRPGRDALSETASLGDVVGSSLNNTGLAVYGACARHVARALASAARAMPADALEAALAGKLHRHVLLKSPRVQREVAAYLATKGGRCRALVVDDDASVALDALVPPWTPAKSIRTLPPTRPTDALRPYSLFDALDIVKKYGASWKMRGESGANLTHGERLTQSFARRWLRWIWACVKMPWDLAVSTTEAAQMQRRANSWRAVLAQPWYAAMSQNRTSQHPHAILVNLFQSADPSSPLLQREWGLTLAAADRMSEAARHLRAAAILYADASWRALEAAGVLQLANGVEKELHTAADILAALPASEGGPMPATAGAVSTGLPSVVPGQVGREASVAETLSLSMETMLQSLLCEAGRRVGAYGGFLPLKMPRIVALAKFAVTSVQTSEEQTSTEVGMRVRAMRAGVCTLAHEAGAAAETLDRLGGGSPDTRVVQETFGTGSEVVERCADAVS